jgi:hypothetical protein
VVDVAPFLTTRDVMVDDFCTTSLPLATPPGPPAARTRSAGVPVALCGQWPGLGSARGVSRSAQRHLRAAFLRLPTREQGHRQVRQHDTALGACFLPLVPLLAAPPCP